MSRAPRAAVRSAFLLLACLLALGSETGCSSANPNKKKALSEACERNLDCAYGLECVAAGKGRTCERKSFGDCEGDGVGPDGKPQCVSGQKCRDNRCTMACAGDKDCKDGQVCKIGACQKAAKAQLCYDNRDCPWPETCAYGQCITHMASGCQTDGDCPAAYRCMSGRCVY